MQLHSEQGKTFESQVFGEVKRPQSDGMVERANRTIESL